VTISQDDRRSSVSRLGRRKVLGVAAGTAALALAPPLASAASATAPELQASQSGTLAGSVGGTFALYQISSPTSAPVTLTLIYSPFLYTWASGIGFHVYQHGATLASVSGQTGLPASRTPTATFTPSASGGPVLIQLFNYSNAPVSYRLTSSTGSPVATTVATAASTAPNRYVYVGTYSAPNTAPGGTAPSTSVGIYVYKMTGPDGGLSLVQSVPAQNPSWVVVDPSRRFLYSTNELGTVNGQPGGRVSAYAINPANGRLTFLNTQLTAGTAPAYCSVHPSGRYLLGTNYSTGNFPVFPINADGSLGAMSDNYQDQGSGPNRARQEGPHAHEIITDPLGQYVFGANLGTDRVDVWTFDLKAGKLVPNQPLNYIQVAGGSGPRHLAFTPNSKWFYAISEMASSITAFDYDPKTGLATWIQTVSTLPADFTGSSAGSELTVHPSGRFLYGANRGANTIAAFAIDQNTGKLSPIGWTSTQGQIPRNFAIDPSGSLLYAANQNSDSIVAFAINPNSGALTPTGQVIASPVPVCVAFGPTV
jgi:6-phosphogluconolactonase